MIRVYYSVNKTQFMVFRHKIKIFRNTLEFIAVALKLLKL